LKVFLEIYGIFFGFIGQVHEIFSSDLSYLPPLVFCSKNGP